jgi:hypothetical protein
MYLWAAVFSGAILWFSLERVPRPGAANHHGQPVLVFVVITAAAILALVLMSLPWLRKRDQAAKQQAAGATAGPGQPPAEPVLAPPARSVVGSGPPADPWLGPRSDQFSWHGRPAGPAEDAHSGGNGKSRTGSAASAQPPPAGPVQAPDTTTIPAVDLLGRTGDYPEPDRSWQRPDSGRAIS